MPSFHSACFGRADIITELGPVSLVLNWYQGSVPGGVAAEVKNVRSYTVTPPIRFQGVDGDKVTLLYLHELDWESFNIRLMSKVWGSATDINKSWECWCTRSPDCQLSIVLRVTPLEANTRLSGEFLHARSDVNMAYQNRHCTHNVILRRVRAVERQ